MGVVVDEQGGTYEVQLAPPEHALLPSQPQAIAAQELVSLSSEQLLPNLLPSKVLGGFTLLTAASGKRLEELLRVGIPPAVLV